MADYPINDRDNQGTLARDSRGRRSRTGRRRRQILLPMERLEDRTLLSFSPIAQPGDPLPGGTVYTAGTTNLSAEIPADGDTVTSLSESGETLNFSYALTAATVPPTWATWGSPPATESATPRVLDTAGSEAPLTISLSQPANVFGFEAEPLIYSSFTLTADFYEGAKLVGSISQSVNGNAGALLFAGATNQAFTSVVITQESGASGIAIAEPRFGPAAADLSLTKTVSPTQAPAGQQVTYSLNLSNASSADDALGTTLTDPLPAGTSFQGVGTLPTGWTETNPGIGNGGTVTFTDSNPFAAGDSDTFTITAQINSGVPAGTIVTNTATASSTNSNSPSASASLNVTVAPLSASPGLTFTGTAGLATPATTLIGSFTDANPADTIADFTTAPGSVVVNWGDGSAPQTLTAANLSTIGVPNGVTFEIDASHTYDQEGQYPVTITVKNVAGAATVISSTALIADAAVTPGAPAGISVNTGQALPAGSIIGTFTDANPFELASAFTATIDWGDGSSNSIGTISQPGGVGTAFDVSGTHTYAVHGSYTPTILLTQAGGSPTTLTSPATATITVTDAAVTGSTKDFTAVVGTNTGPFVLATFTDPDTLATVADVTASLAAGGWGDGTPTSATGPGSLVVQEIGVTPSTSATNPGAPIFEVLGSHTYTTVTAAGTPDPLSVVVTTLGGATTTLTSPAGGGVTVADAPITASGASITGVEGITTGSVVIATFSDANPDATVADFTTSPGSIVVNWGDGSSPETLTASDVTASGSPNGVLFTVTAAHTYAVEGAYQLTVVITDSGGSKASANGTATIADAPLTAAATQPTVSTTASSVYPIPEFGAPVFTGLVAEFTDANPKATISEYQVTIDWGDGTPQSAGTVTQPGGVGTTFDVTGSHTYADAGSTGTYPITVYIHDVGDPADPTVYNGSSLTVSNTATVTDVPIVLTGAVNPATVSGQSTGTLNVTNDNQPAFSGASQAFSAVTLTATPSAGGTPITLGTTQAQANGAWNLTSTVALPSNTYVITASAINQFGDASSKVTTTIAPTLEIDTVAPVITDLTFDRFNSTMVVTFQDNLSGMDLASLENSAFYHLSGKQLVYNVHVPSLILPTAITVSPGATPSDPVVVTVVFRHGKVLRGGLYFIEIDSGDNNNGIEDNAENALSGRYYGTFPTGDGRPGGDFIASIETFHKVVKPLVPNGAGYVPPSKAVDPPAGSSTATGHAHLKSSKQAKVSSPSKADKVVHRAKSLVNQSAGDKSTLDKALDSLVHESGDRPQGR
jgi:large repetitive protein